MKKRNVLIIIGLIVFVAIAGGISYSFFVYNKDVADVSLTTGNISINLANINGNLNLINVIPKTDSEGIASTDYLDFTVTGTVDTEKIYYEVYILPKSNSTLNASFLKTYLTDQTNNVINGVTLYGSLQNSEIAGGKIIYRGLIDLSNDYSARNETKDFRLRLWLDENYPELSSKAFNFDIYLYAKNVEEDFSLIPPICKRATVLHTEECTQSSDYCYADGYYAEGSKNTTTITYGNLGTSGELHTGDAFDCDVNGDGEVNVDGNGKSTERFYYVSPYYDTNNQTFDNTTATLIYYSNTYNNGSSVVASTNGAGYATKADLQTAYPSETFTSYDNWHGPVTALTHLPTTAQWSNIELKNISRAILACSNANCSGAAASTSGGTLPTAFSYSGKAARLLTLPELVNGCKGTINNNTSLANTGSLTACNFLFEGTKYADNSKATRGPWLETPVAYSSNSVWGAFAYYRRLASIDAYSTDYGARPAIDVPMSMIKY